ncbi:MAG TPA: hypothetical protein VE445_02605 [Nitrososphaeraceae archaeon]|nr:hypothetical protein [Nitrososphaeraceae archaeon]
MSRTLPNLENVVSNLNIRSPGPIFSRLFFHLSVTQYWLLVSTIKPVINYVNEEWYLLDGLGLNVTLRAVRQHTYW